MDDTLMAPGPGGRTLTSRRGGGHRGGDGGGLRHSPSSCRCHWQRSRSCASWWRGTQTAIAGGGLTQRAVKSNRHCPRGGGGLIKGGWQRRQQ